MTLANCIADIQAAGRNEERHPVVMELRCRVLRNLDEPFPEHIGDDERLLLREQLFMLLSELDASAGGLFIRAEELSEAERLALAELGLMESRRAGTPDRRGLVLFADPRCSILVGDRDHLRLQCRRENWSLDEAFAETDCLDATIEERVEYAFSEAFGYLTASPRRAGTGLDCQVVLHLPALALRGEMPRLMRGLTALHAESRLLGDGGSPGCLLILRNARTLGLSESEIVDTLSRTVRKLEKLEAKARTAMLSEARSLLEDRVWTAYGQLRYGRLLDQDSARDLLGTLRLGCLAGVLEVVDIKEVQDRWSSMGEGCLQVKACAASSEEALDSLRADQFREWLADGTNAPRKDKH